ncbi:MAG TPA: class I SAM-dependent methyltransferase [Caulobacteraceae bacterium]|jgi:SAM-dependent methyltransferase
MTLNTTTNRYGSIAAELYDLDKPFGALPDTAFHLETLADVAGPILEPACGSGRTLVPLLEAGHDVVGFDPSEEMLDRCRERCAARGYAPDLSRQRFEDFHYDRAFAAVIIPAGSFTLIEDVAVARAVLRRFHDHLAPGGRLILDISPLLILGSDAKDNRQWTAENGDLLTLHGRRVATDWLAQTGRSLLRYERWRDNRLIESQLEPMVQRFWGLDEFALALGAAGFADIGVTGNYARRAPRARDRTITFEARRP